MISHKHKFIFIHIPKTGGSSVENFFTSGYSEGGFESKHKTAISYESEFPDKFREYFTFSTIRNPWEKCFSHYNYRAGDPSQSGFSRHLLFSDWLKRKISNPLVFKTQFDFLKNAYDEILLDHIMRFEKLQEDFDVVCDKIGIPHSQLPHINKTKHKHYTEYYDDETREIVARKYAQDIEHFGYKFGE